MSRNITRGWCFTINNYTEADEHVVFEMEQYAKYVVCGRECEKMEHHTFRALCTSQQKSQ